MSSKITQLLKAWRKFKGLSQRRLAELSGVHRNSISGYERGANSPSEYQLNCICNGLGISLLEFWSGPRGSELTLRVSENYDGAIEGYGIVALNTTELPLFNEIASEGWIETAPEYAGTIPVNAAVANPDRHVVVRVNSNEMYPTFMTGDLVLVDTQKNNPRSNEIVCLVSPDGTPLIRRHKVKNRRRAYVSDNPRYLPIVDSDFDNHIVVGIVTRLVDRDVMNNPTLWPE